MSFCNARFALQGNGTDLNPAPAMGAEWVPEALEIVTAKVRTRPSNPSSLSPLPRPDPDHPSRPFRAPVVGAATSELLLHLHISQVSEAFLPQLKCAVWDWGDRFMGAKHHLEEVGEYFGKIEGPRTPISPRLPRPALHLPSRLCKCPALLTRFVGPCAGCPAYITEGIASRLAAM